MGHVNTPNASLVYVLPHLQTYLEFSDWGWIWGARFFMEQGAGVLIQGP